MKMTKNDFDGVIEHLLDAGISLPEAMGILERGMIGGALDQSRRQPMRGGEEVGDPPQHACSGR